MIIKEQGSFLMIPKAIFELPPVEKAEALKKLKEELKTYQQKRGDVK
ncbi:hypothetical protein [Streptococcus equi]|nr:Uncharacterised protein [Streptococcus equi subsp. zooepidemicus]